MSNREDFPIEGESSTSRIHIPQANRDLQSNWELDLANNIEEYLLKICSGEVSPDHESSINFAEAALLLQGSVQVYSRKVEYLYSLVLAALEFLSEKRQDQQEKTSVQPDGGEPSAVIEDENEVFLGLDDVPVEPKNCLDRRHDNEDTSNHFVKPPANLLVLEGDCLDSSEDASELESYLLATCNFYRDFLLLDPCDAGAVYKFLKGKSVDQEEPALYRGSSVRSKNRRSIFSSPTGRSGGTPHRSSLGKNQGVTLNKTPESSNVGDDSDSDSDDPWKPLNPHEPGNLKIKPFKASKPFGRQISRNSKQNTVTSQFPIAKVDGVISPELAETFEIKRRLQDQQNASQSPPLFEKLRRSFTNGEEETFNAFGGIEDENDCNDDGFPDFDHREFDLPNNTYDMDTELSPNCGKRDDAATFDGTEAFTQDNLGSEASLEDICRSHLDALLASIAETEKQTELATRVSTWKQRIEQTLEEQDTHSAFDIHQYGEMILDRLSSEADNSGSMPFTNVVKGQPKHDVARTFSALLQLVNNGEVDLQRAPANSKLICFTAENPFTVKLLRNSRQKEEMGMFSRKRVKSPSNHQNSSKANPSTSPSKPSNQSGRLSVKLGKGAVIRCTPEGKRRRRSRLASVDLQPAG
ncbi:uncharacterized protein A4U43_C03F12330 [Asparagus officinalis]|uniref:Condensin-2 complex subunit H2 n=1 Tax=Asparagus officinalis TaxID=4686 RepID=A0A5P1F9E0_ASPOF|nr:uncharacterized protein A4U43_C03F12330 [Asparagus officinalis]